MNSPTRQGCRAGLIHRRIFLRFQGTHAMTDFRNLGLLVFWISFLGLTAFIGLAGLGLCTVRSVNAARRFVSEMTVQKFYTIILIYWCVVAVIIAAIGFANDELPDWLIPQLSTTTER
jgi:hypothetical protein